MKKTRMLFLAIFSIVGIIGLASCQKFDCEAGIHDVNEWQSDANNHWHVCDICEQEVDKAQHVWGKWTVTKEATTTETGLKERSCNVCNYKTEVDIPKLDEEPDPEPAPEGGLPDMYVRGSQSGWGTTEDYKLVVNPETNEASIEVLLGLDVEFKIADDTANWDVQFDYSKVNKPEGCFVDNNGNLKVVKPGTYKVVITNVNNPAAAVCTITLIEADESLYPLPDMYVRGSMTGDDWPAVDDYKLAFNEENDTLEISVDFVVGDKFKVADSNWGKQYGWGQFVDETNGALAASSGDIEVLLTATYNIVVSSASDASQSVCTISLDQSSVDPDNPEPVVIPLPDMYVRGSHSGFNAMDEYKLVVNSETNEASIELHLDVDGKFKIADNTDGWTVQFGYADVTLPEGCFSNNNGDIVVVKGGIYKVVITNANDKTKAQCSITLIEEDTEVVVTPLPDMYVMGIDGVWTATEELKLVKNEANDTLEIILDLEIDEEFKIADSGWTKEFGPGAYTDETNGCLGVSGMNMKVLTAGKYKIVVSSASDKSKSACTIYLVEAATPEEPEQPEEPEEPTLIPLPDMYVRGSQSGWNAEEDYKLIVDPETNEASIEVKLGLGVEFKIADNTTGWTVQFAYDKVQLPQGCFSGYTGSNIKVEKAGTYKVVITNVNDNTKAVCTITLIEEDFTPTPLPDMYVRGSMTGEDWPAVADYKFVLNEEADALEITLDFNANDLFKVANDAWGNEFGFGKIIDETNGCLADDWGNIKVVTAGTYKIVLSSASNLANTTCTITKVEAPQPEEPVITNYTVVANFTGGAANNFTVSWEDAQYKVTKKVTKSDFGVSVGIIADLTECNLAENSLQFNVSTGAEPNRTLTVVLHTDACDYKLTIVIEGGTYKSFTEEVVECTHAPVEEPETPAAPTNYKVTSSITGGAANNFTISWDDAQYKVTQPSKVADFTVSIGSIAFLDFFTVNENSVQFNVVTGAQTERTITVVLHTEASDYKLTIIIEGGAYKSLTEEAVECTHAPVEEPETPAAPTNYKIISSTTGGAANNFTISWEDDEYKVTEASTVEDFTVSIGSIAFLDFFTVNENSVQFNVVTGAQAERTLTVVLHTANNDYMLTIVIEGGQFKSLTEQVVQ